jgi:hypothetical protein
MNALYHILILLTVLKFHHPGKKGPREKPTIGDPGVKQVWKETELWNGGI